MRREYAVPALLLLAAIMFTTLTGCATDPLGIAKQGYNTAEKMNRLTSQALREKKISSKNARNVQESTRAAAAGIKIGEEMVAVQPKAGASKIDSSIAILRALENHLLQQGAK